MNQGQRTNYLKPYRMRADLIRNEHRWKYILFWLLGIGTLVFVSILLNEPEIFENLVLAKVRCQEQANIPGTNPDKLKLAQFCSVCFKPTLQYQSFSFTLFPFSKKYEDKHFLLRVDYKDDSILNFKEYEIKYSELSTMCSVDPCDSITTTSDFQNYPALTNFSLSQEEKENKTFNEQFQNKDPREIMLSFENASETTVGIRKINKTGNYFETQPILSRRFFRAEYYSLLLKIKTGLATDLVDRIYLIEVIANPTYETMANYINAVVFFTSIIVFLFTSLDLSNKPYKEWLGISKSIFRNVILQILCSGVIGWVSNFFGSDLTESIKLAEEFLKGIYLILCLSTYLEALLFFFSEQMARLNTIRKISMFILGICYTLKRALHLGAENFPENKLIMNMNSIFSQYFFIFFLVYGLCTGILYSLSFSQLFCGSNQDRYSVLLNLTSFTCLLLTCCSLIWEWLGGGGSSNLFMVGLLYPLTSLSHLVLSSPLSFDEEHDLTEEEEGERRGFGNELRENERENQEAQGDAEIDHILTSRNNQEHEDNDPEEHWEGDLDAREEEFDVDVEFGGREGDEDYEDSDSY